MIPIIRWTLWQRRWSLLWRSLGMAAFVVLTLAFYASFRDQAAHLNQVLDRLPATARALFSDNSNFLTPDGFLSARLYYLLLPLLLSTLTISLGSSLIAKEEDDGTIELLLARPISRGRLLMTKAFSGLIILLTISLVVLLTTLIVCHFVKLQEPAIRIALATLATTILALFFGALAFTITTLGRARGSSIGVAVILGLGGYIISSLEASVHWLRWPAKFLPYHYYRPSEILRGYFSWYNAAGFMAVILVLGLLSWLAFRRRDLSG